MPAALGVWWALCLRAVSVGAAATAATAVRHAHESAAAASISEWDATPAPNTTIFYVSSSAGDDPSARGYRPADPVIGPNPFKPAGAVKAFATVSAAVAASADGQPDWVLLRRGDSWEDGKTETFPLRPKNGKSAAAPALLGAYGEGCARPRLLAGDKFGIQHCCHGFRFVVLDGVELYAHTRDPAVVGVKNLGVTNCTSGVYFIGPSTGNPGVLIQNSVIRFFSTNIDFTGNGPNTDVVIRNNVVVDAYSSCGAHSQGMYGHSIVGIQLHNNVFDHNGWLELPAGHPLQKIAGATIFNHNTYIGESSDLVMTGNMFLRGSSMGNKYRSDAPAGETGIVVDNNLYVEGELGMSIGGNTPEYANGTARFTDVSVTNNVLVEIGRSRPTNRSLSWGLGIQDWRGGAVTGNLFVNVTNPVVTNTYAIAVSGSVHDVTVGKNIVYNLLSKGALLEFATDKASGITVNDNVVDTPFSPVVLGADTNASNDWGGYAFSGNTYWSSAPASSWFQTEVGGDGKTRPLSLAEWDAMVHGTGSKAQQPTWPDASRSLEAYAAAHGGNASFVSFWSNARELPCGAGASTPFTATLVNDYLRGGFFTDAALASPIVSNAGTDEPQAAVAGSRHRPSPSQALPARSTTPAQQGNITSNLLTAGFSVLPDGSAFFDVFRFFGAGAMTSNLPLQVPAGAKNGGSSLVLPANGDRDAADAVVPKCAAGTCVLTTTPTKVVLANLTLTLPSGHERVSGATATAAAATEAWTLELLNASAFRWTVDRTWSAAGSQGPALAVDRVGLSLQTTGGTPIHAHQIPSFVDTDTFLNRTSTGGFGLGSAGGGQTALEYLSPNPRQYVRFSPAGALFAVEGAAAVDGADAPVLWSFAKPFADGTTWCNIGFEGVDPRAGLRQGLAAGATQRFTMTMHLVEQDIPTSRAPKGAAGVAVPPQHAYPAMDVRLPNATLQDQMAVIVGSQYQLMGWFMGNNPASSPCLHEMAHWPLMASLFPAGSVAFSAMQKELSFFAECGYQPKPYPVDGVYETIHSCSVKDGAKFGLSQRYAARGFYNAPWGPLQDQNVMFPIAVYYTAAASGDTAWLRSMRPALDAIAEYLGANGLAIPSDSGGVGDAATGEAGRTPSEQRCVFVSPGSGRADGKHHASNWYDVIEFGHKDAFLAVWAVWGVQCLAEIYAALGDAAAAAAMSRVHARAVSDFNTVFWNETLGQYHDWIDVDGRARSYFYVDVAFVAVIAGVADGRQAATLLGHYDRRLAEIYTEYRVDSGAIWSPPCNLYPVTDRNEYSCSKENFPPKGKWNMTFPMYENGGAFFHTAGLQFAALGATGQADRAVEGFATLMNSGFGKVRGWAQQLWWTPGGGPSRLDPAGGDADPLNTAALSVWGFMRAGFGVATSLRRGGVVAVNRPAAALRGARWNVSALGEHVCLEVGDGVTTFCNGTAVPPAPRRF